MEGKMKNDEGADQVQSVAEAEGHRVEKKL